MNIGDTLIDGNREFFYPCLRKRVRTVAEQNYFYSDSMPLTSLIYGSNGKLESQVLYSDPVDSIGYGLAIFYDTATNRVKNVQVIGIRKKPNRRSYQTYSQRYLETYDSQSWLNWKKPLQPTNFLYPIDSYH